MSKMEVEKAVERELMQMNKDSRDSLINVRKWMLDAYFGNKLDRAQGFGQTDMAVIDNCWDILNDLGKRYPNAVNVLRNEYLDMGEGLDEFKEDLEDLDRDVVYVGMN